jgi:hypothetical protein
VHASWFHASTLAKVNRFQQRVKAAPGRHEGTRRENKNLFVERVAVKRVYSFATAAGRHDFLVLTEKH